MRTLDLAQNIAALRNWKQPLGVIGGFLAFCIVCGAVDTSMLAGSYRPLDPVTEVKEVYVDPVPVPASPAAGGYTYLDALSFAAPEAPAAPSEDGGGNAVMAAAMAESPFLRRFESFQITPPASAAEEAAGGGTAGVPYVAPKTVNVSPSAGGYEKMLAWKEAYPDVVGYLKIPGTNIEHPVVWNANNLYYEHRDLNKQYSHSGVIWADQDVTPSSRNTILYGHNWTNYSATPRIGSASDIMFAQLTGYQYASFAQSHPTIQYANANGDGTYVVFGAFYTTELGSYTSASMSPTSALAMAKRLNLYNFSTEVTDSDKFITLSTCTRYFGAFEAQRFVVMARKLRDGEKANITISSKA